MFDKLYVCQVRDELVPRLRGLKYKIVEDETKRFVAAIRVKDRDVEVRLIAIHKNTVTVDIIDPFGIVRIPRKTFKKLDDFKVFLITDFTKLTAEYYK